MLHVEVLTDSAGLEALALEWEELHTRLTPRIPFTSPLWNILWWRHFQQRCLWIRDELYVHVVRHGKRLIAVAPMILTHRPNWGPLRLRELQFFGADSNITEIRGLVCEPEHQEAVIEALSNHLHSHPKEWHWIFWNGIRNREGAPETLSSAISIGRHQRVVDYYLPLPTSWEELKSGFSRNVKEAIRKCYNSLQRANHTFTFRVVRAPEDVPAAIEILFQLHKARADAINVKAHPDAFATSMSRNFLEDFAVRAARRDQVRIFQLEIGGNIVATRLGFAFGDELYLHYSGSQPEWGKFSVMTTLVVESFKWAIDNGMRGVNLSTGTDSSKTRWRPLEIEFFGGVQRSPTLAARFFSRLNDDGVRTALRASRLGRIITRAKQGRRARGPKRSADAG